MKKLPQSLACVLSVLMVVTLPGGVYAQKQSKASRSSKTFEQKMEASISVVHSLTLGCELPGARLQLVIKGLAGDPIEAFESLYLTDGKQAKILQNLNDLQGHVKIGDGPMALRYVRLLTSSETWFLWKGRQLEVEIMEAGEAAAAPNYGLKEQGRFLSSPVAMTAIKGGFQRTSWHYNGRTRKMELVQNTFRNDHDSEKVLKTIDPPDLTLLGDGSMGILPRKDFRAGGFFPATVSPVPGGFQITRWLYVEDYRGKKATQSVCQVQEFVGADGTYRQTVLKTNPPPKLPTSQLSIPKFE